MASRAARALALIWARVKERRLARVGPGLITGVADDDPSGIATYSQAGAQFGLNMLWTVPLAFPLMAAIQSICARIGRVTGEGLAVTIKTAFPPGVVRAVVLALLVANTLNIAADLAAMGEVGQLVTGLDRHAMTMFFVFASLLLQVFVPYHRYVGAFFLKWLTLSLVAYFWSSPPVHVPWKGRGDQHLLAAAVHAQRGGRPRWWWASSAPPSAPYLFFWQASRRSRTCTKGAQGSRWAGTGRAAGAELRRIRWDTWSGMAYSDLTAFCIILATLR